MGQSPGIEQEDQEPDLDELALAAQKAFEDFEKGLQIAEAKAAVLSTSSDESDYEAPEDK